MDKINFERWDNYFGKTSHELIFASERYSETDFSFSENGLPSGRVKSITTPGLMLTELHIHSCKPFQFVDMEGKEKGSSS